MATEKINFTKASIDRLTCPAGSKRATYWDSKQRNLALRVTPNGTKVFYWSRRVKGRARWIRIARVGDMKIDDVRGVASDYNGLAAKGIDPGKPGGGMVGERTTLGQLWDMYLSRHAEPHKRPASVKMDKSYWNAHIKGWKNRRLEAINRPDVIDLHRKIGEKSPCSANRCVALLRKMFSLAQDWGYEGANPASRVRFFKEESRDRFMSGHEIKRFFLALRRESRDYRDLWTIALLTGARKANFLSMAWSEIDLERRVWTIPASKAKSGKPMDNPLAPQVMEILERRKRDVRGPYVFPSPLKAGEYIKDVRESWKRVCRRARLRDLRIHDLRRTLGSWQAAAGASLPIIARTLGHTDPSSTRVYARLDLDPIRASVENAVGAMMAAREKSAKQKKAARGEETTEG